MNAIQADALAKLRELDGDGLAALTVPALADLSETLGLPRGGRKADLVDRLHRLAAGEAVRGLTVCPGCASAVVEVSPDRKATSACPHCHYKRGAGAGTATPGTAAAATAGGDGGGDPAAEPPDGPAEPPDADEATAADRAQALVRLRSMPRNAVTAMGALGLRRICAALGLETSGERSEVLARVLAAFDGGEAWRVGERLCPLCRRGTMTKTTRTWRAGKGTPVFPVYGCRACGYKKHFPDD